MAVAIFTIGKDLGRSIGFVAAAEGAASMGLGEIAGAGKVARAPSPVDGDDNPASGYGVFSELWQCTSPFFTGFCGANRRLYLKFTAGLCSGRPEDIAKVGDRWRSGKYDVDGIETDLLPKNIGLTGEFPGGADQARLLLLADGAIRSAVLIGLAGFDLDENELIILPTDQINFAGSGGHAIVAGDDDDPMTLQVTVGNILAAAAQGVIRSEVAMASVVPEHISEFIQASHHR